ncbi:MAG: hypothetical protein ACAI43_17810 [Phycisphaerae bacterium]
MRNVTLALVALILAGCQSAKVPDPITAKLGGSDADSQMEFWHTLAGRNLCSNDEAFHGLLLFLDGTDPATDYAGRLALLKKRGLVHADFNEPGDLSVKRGTLAVAIVRTLKIKGGLFQHLTNDHPRYATRELMFMELYPLSSPHQTFSGTEFVGVIGKLEDYQRGNPADYPAAVLPGEAASGANPGSTQNPATTNPTIKEGDKPAPPAPATVKPDVQDPSATPAPRP